MKEYNSKAMRILRKNAGSLGLGSAVITGASDMAHAIGYNTLDMPGPYLAVPAALFAAGQTARTIDDINNRHEYWNDMPFIYKLPRYAKNVVSTLAPYAALGFLISGNPEIANAGAIGSSAAWIGSEAGLGKLSEFAESKYLDKHPEIRLKQIEKELIEALKSQKSH
ncbi:MAG: hypothetical protein V1802_00765 [Candidatus Aenigmatarchaeota archaeon]